MSESLALFDNTYRDRVVAPRGRTLRQTEILVTTTIIHHDWNCLITPSIKGNRPSLNRSSSCHYALVGEHSFTQVRIRQLPNNS